MFDQQQPTTYLSVKQKMSEQNVRKIKTSKVSSGVSSCLSRAQISCLALESFLTFAPLHPFRIHIFHDPPVAAPSLARHPGPSGVPPLLLTNRFLQNWGPTLTFLVLTVSIILSLSLPLPLPSSLSLLGLVCRQEVLVHVYFLQGHTHARQPERTRAKRYSQARLVH